MIVQARCVQGLAVVRMVLNVLGVILLPIILITQNFGYIPSSVE